VAKLRRSLRRLSCVAQRNADRHGPYGRDVVNPHDAGQARSICLLFSEVLAVCNAVRHTRDGGNAIRQTDTTVSCSCATADAVHVNSRIGDRQLDRSHAVRGESVPSQCPADEAYKQPQRSVVGWSMFVIADLCTAVTRTRFSFAVGSSLSGTWRIEMSSSLPMSIMSCASQFRQAKTQRSARSIVRGGAPVNCLRKGGQE